MAEQRVTILALLQDRLSRPLGGINRAFRGMTRTVQTLARTGGRAIGVLTRGVGALRRSVFSLRSLILAAGLAGSVSVFSGLESGLANVSTLVDTAKVDITELGDGVKRVSQETGQDFQTLTQALFDVVSAGVDGSRAIGVLNAASRLATAGATDTGSAVKGLVSILNAYGLEADQAANVSDSLFQAQKSGITTIELLSTNLGKLAPVARTVGLSIDEMNAGVAALTKGGLSTEEAITALRSTLSALINPSEDSARAAEELGIEWNIAGLRAKGFADFIAQLGDSAGASEAQIAALSNNNIRAFIGVAGLAADNASNLRDTLDQMAEKAGATDEAFEKTNKTVAFLARQIKQELFVAVVELVEIFEPFIKDFGQGLRGSLRSFGEFIERNQIEIEVFVRTTIERLRQLVGFIRGEFESGRLGNLVGAAIKASLDLAIDALQLAAPALLSAGKLLGQSLALGLSEPIADAVQSILSFIASPVRLLASALAKLEGVPLFDTIGTAASDLVRDLREFEELSGDQLTDGIDTDRTRRELQDASRKLGDFFGNDAARAFGDSFRKGLSADGRVAFDAIFDDPSVEARATALSRRLNGVFAAALDAQVSSLLSLGFEITPGFIMQAAEQLLAAQEMLREAAVEAATSTEQQTAIDQTRRLVRESEGFFERFANGVNASVKQAISDLEAAIQTVEDAAVLVDRLRDSQTLFDGGKISEDDFASRLERTQDEIARLIESTPQFREELLLLQIEVDNIGSTFRGTEGSGGFFGGFSAGFSSLITQFASLKEAGRSFAESIATGLSDVVAGFFEADFSFSKFAANFLKQIAQMITQLVLFNLLKKAFSSFGIPGFNEGGEVGGAALGFSSGGGVPGPRVDRDVVPAKLTPGEWVHRAAAVRHYGADVMDALNRMAVPRELFSGLRGKSVRSLNLAGRFRSGGGIDGVGAGAAGGASQTVLIANEQTAERIFNGGPGAVFRFFRENRDTLRGILGAPAG